MIMKLTKRALDIILPTTRPIVAYDIELKGFGIRVASNGGLSWFVEYRPGAGGRRVAKRRMVIGGREFTPDEARKAAREILAGVALGKDPAAIRRDERQAATFKEFAERYIREEAEAKLKPGTVTNYKICVGKHANPELGTIKLNRISTADIARMHSKIGLTRPMTANRVVECVSSIFRYAATCGLIPFGHNPTRGIRAFREHRRERFLSSDELGRLGDAIRLAESVGIPYDVDHTKPNIKHAPKIGNRVVRLDPYAAAALRLLILTGARLREILNLKWEYVDVERGLLLLPDSKTGRKTIVLNAPAMAILQNLPRCSAYVLSDGDKPRADLNRPWKMISRHAGLPGVRLHDLRHTHASIGAGAGLGLPIIGKLLGHSQASTTSRYAHLDASPLRIASELIAGKIASAMGDTLGPNDAS
jgi:integrase